jgi:hypothetical protein
VQQLHQPTKALTETIAVTEAAATITETIAVTEAAATITETETTKIIR